MTNEKNIPFRNYVILACILIFSILLVIYLFMWCSEFRNSKIYNPILDKYLTVINYNEVDHYLVENKKVVLYVSELSDVKIRNFESKFKKNIVKYSFNEDILYLNLSEEKKDTKLYNTILKDYQLENLPSIVIFENGVVYDVYDIKSNNYNVNLLISYLMIEGVIYD